MYDGYAAGGARVPTEAALAALARGAAWLRGTCIFPGAPNEAELRPHGAAALDELIWACLPGELTGMGPVLLHLLGALQNDTPARGDLGRLGRLPPTFVQCALLISTAQGPPALAALLLVNRASRALIGTALRWLMERRKQLRERRV